MIFIGILRKNLVKNQQHQVQVTLFTHLATEFEFLQPIKKDCSTSVNLGYFHSMQKKFSLIMKLAFKISIIRFCILGAMVNNGAGGAGQVQVVNEPKKMEAKELLS